MRIIFAISITILIPLFMACEKLMIEKDPDNSPENNFELLWNIIDRNYSFFEYKNINWDSIKHIYQPKINDSMTNRQLFDVMSDMLFELRDGHVNLYWGTERSKNWDWYSDYPANFNYNLLEANYINKETGSIGPFQTASLDSIGYIYCGTFAERIRESEIDIIIDNFQDMKGIIIDVRNNTGGYSVNGTIIASRFADSMRLASYTLYKTGPGHGDFSQPQPNYISPEGEKQFLKPVVVLTNRRTFSAANDFVLTMTSLPGVKVIGDKTGGGGGTPYDYELLNGWRCRFPRTQTLSPDKFNVEKGIPPFIHVNMNVQDEIRGMDTIIERAINYLKRSFSESV